MIVRNTYRGVHRAGTWIDGRTTAISFSARDVAVIYATNPNCKGDIVENPRVYCCDLTIKKPLFDNPGDSFISCYQLIDAIGPAETLDIYRTLKAEIMATDAWAKLYEEFKISYDIMFEFRKFERHLFKLDVPLWPLLAHDRYVHLFKEKGFDGAIFMGSGAGAGVTEFVIFDRDQARQLSLEYIGV